MTPGPYRFHAYEVSYFSAKVRPALRYKGLWYEERRADYREIGRRINHYFIPIVITPDDETWQDSTEIYDRLEERHPDPPLFPNTPVQRIAAHLFELYADEFGLLPAMHYRWGTPRAEAMARARFIAMTGSEKYGNQSADRMVHGRQAVGATDATAPVIEAHTRELLDALSTHFETHPYLLGERMSFADCAMMGPLYGHLFNDHVSRPLLLETAMPVVSWIERCNIPNTDLQGEWLAGDGLAPTAREVLRTMGRDAAPVILDMVRTIEDWADTVTDADGETPRSAGACRTSLRGIPFERQAPPYTLWSLGRVIDQYTACSATDRSQVDAAIEGTGWEEVLTYQPRHRIVKRGFDLALA